MEQFKVRGGRRGTVETGYLSKITTWNTEKEIYENERGFRDIPMIKGVCFGSLFCMRKVPEKEK